MNDTPRDNPDRAFINSLLDKADWGSEGVALETNAFFRSVRARLLGGVPGDVQVGFTMGEDVIQGNGVIGGGALASMLDCATATATLSALKTGFTCATINITINMMSAGQVGDFRAQAVVEKMGRRVAYVTAKLHDPKGKLIATASCAMAITEL